jgi:hypothetical protein
VAVAARRAAALPSLVVVVAGVAVALACAAVLVSGRGARDPS